MSNLKPLKHLPNFIHFCCTIGNIPTSYVSSLSYEEQLFWLCDFLEKNVLPAINQNAQATEELQTLLNDLKNYVNNYFENLDITKVIKPR